MSFKDIIVTLILLIPGCPGAIAQQVIAASAGEISDSSCIIYYTIGQTFFHRTEDGYASVSEGIQVPYEIILQDRKDCPAIPFSISLTLAPAGDLLRLNIDQPICDNLYFSMTDLQGRIIRDETITDQVTNISLAGMPVAVYLLCVRDDIRLLRTFKIIKK